MIGVKAMAELPVWKIKVDNNLRPCLAYGKKALFHRLHTRYRLLDASPLCGGHPGGQVSFNMAVVEYEDGSMAEVPTGGIKFLDTPYQMAEFEGCYYTAEQENEGNERC